MWLALLLVPVVVLPVLEIYVILTLGEPYLGWPLTVVLLFSSSVLGAVLLRAQGKAVWLRLVDALKMGQVPYREMIDGALISLGAALMLAPGFVSDIMGLLLLAPPSRTIARNIAMRLLERQIIRRIVSPRGLQGSRRTG